MNDNTVVRAVFVVVTNDRDGLDQARWAELVNSVGAAVETAAADSTAWFSAPTAGRQSACWQLTPIDLDRAAHLQIRLARLARTYHLDGISWAAAETRLIYPYFPHLEGP